MPVWAFRDLAEADGVVVVNRVKPHTDFHGEVESGLVKMLVIGAGKHAGALSAHHLTVRHGFPAVLADHGERLLAGLPVLCGIAVVEDQRDRTAMIEVMRPDEFFTREPALLGRARELLPRLPFARLDVLVIDRLGKDVSGAGMDTNVTGRASFWGGGERPTEPRITRIFVRGLTPATHGNACGIGMADFTTARCAAEIDRAATNVNCITSNSPEDARPADRLRHEPGEAIAAAIQTSGVPNPAEVRLVWVRDTAHLEQIVVSEALLEEVRAGATLRPAGPLFPLPYDENGDLRSPFSERAPAPPGIPGARRRVAPGSLAPDGASKPASWHPAAPPCAGGPDRRACPATRARCAFGGSAPPRALAPSRLTQVVEGTHAGVVRHVAQHLLDSQQLVVLGDAICAPGAPLLIWPALVATAMSAMVVSSVSPLRWLQRRCSRQPSPSRSRQMSRVSVPIWLRLDADAVGDALLDAFSSRSTLVTNTSSPTIWTWHAEFVGQ